MGRDEELTNFPGFRSRLQQFPNFGSAAPTNILNHQRHTIASRRRRCSFIKALADLEATQPSPPRRRSFFKFGSMRSTNTSSSNNRSSDNNSSGNSPSSASTEKASPSTFHSRFTRKIHVADVFYKLPHLYREEERNVSTSSTGTIKHNPQLQNRPFLEHASLFTPTQLVTPRPKFSQCTFTSTTPETECLQPIHNTHKSSHKFAPLSSSPPEFRPSFMRSTTSNKSESGQGRCPVCLQGFTKKVAVQPCNHALCADCFAHWQMHCYELKKYASCPECMIEVDDIKWLP